MKDAHWLFTGHVLDQLEKLEFPLLSWGVTSEALSEKEVLDAIEDAMLEHPDAPSTRDSQQFLEWMTRKGLLFRVPSSSPPRYRTRFAEALRLTSQLRQLFPQHRGKIPESAKAGWWQQGARLVADYRLHSAKRRYPKRDVPAETALGEFSELPNWTALQADVASAVVNNRKLSRFQIDATKSIYNALGRRKSSGIIVGAGTGSGKTLSFYLPALTGMAGSPGSQVQTLALYPRKELLRDQLREALLNAELIKPAINQHNKRQLRLGALYGDTPWTADDLTKKTAVANAWPRRSRGYSCPYLTCPRCTVGEMVWPYDKHKAGVEELHCLNCSYKTSPGQLGLTRTSLTSNPPGLLFTTTEMLNRNSTHPELGRLLGWTGGRAPRLMLLDEVHTYTGVHGAQVALLLRRWQHAVGRRPVTFVGLSATLREAQRFFGQLTGLSDGNVAYIEPSIMEMEEEGREYALALRGDPLSGASLLSTSIQTAMLFGRVLDPPGDEGLYGSTAFLFTDDLDVTNRYYRNLRDAEGQVSPPRPRVLAGLRSPAAPYRMERYADGQSWDLVEKIGPPLSSDLFSGGLKVARTSSQDAGVNLAARLIVATASLEVGFNDPRVGLVMQHKAPYDTSSFIQRRGRAGRQRRTRPLTIVTLSDYGRDRLTYQAYENLFAPQVTASSLPIRNRYVLKIQATQAFLDWLQEELRPSANGKFNVRAILTAPLRPGAQQSPALPLNVIANLLEELLREDSTRSVRQDSLARHLEQALKVSADEVQALMWEQPRSIMLGVVPTLLRRLRTQWQPVRKDPGAVPGTLLPEFVTQSLFAPLNLPEVELALPFAAEEGEERMAVGRALREAVPGRVSRRYGYRNDRDRTWLPLPPDGGTEIDLEHSFLDDNYQLEGHWQPIDGPGEPLTVIRPYRIKLESPPEQFDDRSQSVPLWGTDIEEVQAGPANDLEPAGSSSWLKDVRTGFRTHAGGNPVTVRRMTFGADATISVKGAEERRQVRYSFQGAPAALGFELLVDAFKVEIPRIELARPQVQKYLRSPQWRTQAFMRAVEEDPVLLEVTNVFKRRWLALIYFTAFSLRGLESSRSAAELWESLKSGSWADELERILQVLYRSDEVSTATLTDTRLVRDLRALGETQSVQDALDRAGLLLFTEDVADRTVEFARRAYRDTMAAAILAATLRLCPDAQESDVILDVFPSPDDDSETIWLSETSVGGLGVIEHLVRVYTASPQQFWSTVITTLKPNEYEYVDATVTRLLRNIVDEEPDGPAALAVQAMRSANSIAEAEQALGELRTAWAELDGPPRHNAVATLSTRVLRPGSGPDTDAESLRLLDVWNDAEQRLGFEIDARVVAYAVGTGAVHVSDRELRADQAFSMLWPRGAQARSNHLQHYQPFTPLEKQPIHDRLLVENALDERVPRIDITQDGWDEEYSRGLAEVGAVDLDCSAQDRDALSCALVLIPLIPVERDVLRLYGEIEGVSRAGERLLVRVVLREVE